MTPFLRAIRYFSFARFFAILFKEFIQMRRDRVTMGMIIGVPIMQLTLFGFAINLNPKELPTAIAINDPGIFSRSLTAAVANSDYFDLVEATNSPKRARQLLDEGKVTFVIEVPVNFTRDLVRGANPQLLIETDATDPAAGSYALGAFGELASRAMTRDMQGALNARLPKQPPFEVVVHRLYNPESNTQINIVPGLLGVILTMTMVLLTAMAITRERERGTYENLLAMPANPLEIMLGKIAPNVVVGYIQSLIIMLAAVFVFGVPIEGSLLLLLFAMAIFITANLSIGYTMSTVATNQMQAMQMTFFFLLPSIFLSGFAFPFGGMPGWAQTLGEILPLTHFLRIVRGILLKGNGFAEIWPNLWPLLVFMTVALGIALARFRRTLD